MQGKALEFSISALLISMHNATENFGFKVTFKLEFIKIQLLYKDNLVFKNERIFSGLTGILKC